MECRSYSIAIFPNTSNARLIFGITSPLRTTGAKTNRRRGHLIAREVEGTITENEATELRTGLQDLADLRTDLWTRSISEELEQLHAEIAIRSNG